MSHLADCYQSAGDSAQAIEMAGRSVSMAPSDLNVVTRAGLIFEKAGARDSAVELIGRALSMGYPRAQLEALPELVGLFSDPRLKETEPASSNPNGGKN